MGMITKLKKPLSNYHDKLRQEYESMLEYMNKHSIEIIREIS